MLIFLICSGDSGKEVHIEPEGGGVKGQKGRVLVLKAGGVTRWRGAGLSAEGGEVT